MPLTNDEKRNQIVWNQFLGVKQTLPTENRDYTEWHRGRGAYAVWTIPILSKQIQSRFDAAKAILAKFLLEPYKRQAHMTLFVCGFLADVKRWDDDYPVDELMRHLSELTEAKFRPFKIEVGGVNSFEAAPFLEVFDVSGGIEKIREVFLSGSPEIREDAYIPHLTLGLYGDYFEAKTVAEKISSFPRNQRIEYFVDEIRLMTYSAFEIAGPLTTEYSIHLEGGRKTPV